VTEAVYALNFGSAGQRLASSPGTRDISTLVVYSARQECHFSLHFVPSNRGDWISGLRVEYGPGSIVRRVRLREEVVPGPTTSADLLAAGRQRKQKDAIMSKLVRDCFHYPFLMFFCPFSPLVLMACPLLTTSTLTSTTLVCAVTMPIGNVLL